MLETRNNIRTLVSRLDGKQKSFIRNLKKRFKESYQLFIKRIQKIQLSGRVGNIYLFKRTGALYRSWTGKLKASEQGFNIRVSIESNSPYVQYHQKGTDRLPKRLFINEDWNKAGKELLTSDVRQALKEFTRK